MGEHGKPPPTRLKRALTGLENARFVWPLLLVAIAIIGAGSVVRALNGVWELLPEAIGREQRVAAIDARTHEIVLDVAKTIDAHLLRLSDADRPSYVGFAASYRDIEIELRNLQLRNRVRSNNEITTRQLENLLSSWRALSSVHQDQDDVSPAFIETVRDLLDTSVGAILTWEVARRNETQ